VVIISCDSIKLISASAEETKIFASLGFDIGLAFAEGLSSRVKN
jgi:hypothetical protein